MVASVNNKNGNVSTKKCATKKKVRTKGIFIKGHKTEFVQWIQCSFIGFLSKSRMTSLTHLIKAKLCHTTYDEATTMKMWFGP